MSSEVQSSPPFTWTQHDMTFVASELAGEFPTVSTTVIEAAIAAAVQKVPPAEGRVSLAKATRQFLRSP